MHIYVKHTGVSSVQEFTAWLEEVDPVIVGKLETPITYQLTPQQIKTVCGRNSIWPDAGGESEVVYWTH